MLKKFSVKNYKSFKDELVIDFSDFKDYQYNTHAIENNLISTAVIYGKNSSGKTNLGFALFDITLHLVDKEQVADQHTNYLNANSDESVAAFSYSFLFDKDEVTYRYRKQNSKKLTYEELYVNDKKVFSYNFLEHKSDFSNLSYIQADTLNFGFKDMNLSVVRYIANNSNLDKNSFINKLMNFVSHMLWFRSIGVNNYIGYYKGVEQLMDQIIKNGSVSKFEKFLKNCGIDHDLTVAKDVFGNDILAVKFNHRVIPFWEIASNGTQALTLYFYWSQKFTDITFLFIDEFDAFYHTDLAETMIKEISQKKDFQTILTTHNTALMSNRFLRPDCYFILSNNRLYSLPKCTEKELREGHNLEKMYRNGEFIES